MVGATLALASCAGEAILECQTFVVAEECSQQRGCFHVDGVAVTVFGEPVSCLQDCNRDRPCPDELSCRSVQVPDGTAFLSLDLCIDP